MIYKFTSVVFDSTQKDMARVNRVNGSLYLNPQIWGTLPEGENEFVLFREKGNLILQTKEDFNKNNDTVKNFKPTHILSNPDKKKSITVMSTIATDGQISGFWPFSSKDSKNESDSSSDGTSDNTSGDTKKDNTGVWVSSISNVIGSVFQALPLLGVGTASRQKEIAAKSSGELALANAQAKADANTKQTYVVISIVVGAFFVCGIVAYLALKKR